jgi:phosphoglycerate dehydrogenase-like enzyme
MKAFVAARISQQGLLDLAEKFELVQSDHFEKGNLEPRQLAEKMSGCQLAVIENDNVTAEVLEACPELIVIVDFRGTVDNVDLHAAARQGVVVLHTPGRNAQAVADFTVGLMIAAARQMIRGIDALRANQWQEKGARWMYVNHQGYDLPGKTIGLVGLGAIGRLVAKRLAGFDVYLVGYDPFVTPEAASACQVTWLPLQEVLSTSHIVSLHVPLTESTRGMIAEPQLRAMKPEAYLINTSRADIIDNQALLQCMQQAWITGAALDVFSEEPIPSDHPLAVLPNVICTPHLGGATCDVVANHTRIGMQGLRAFLSGQTPAHCANPQALELARQRWQTLN